jgi:translation initiation factor 4A
VILSPTRELAEQTHKVISALSQFGEKDSEGNVYSCSAILAVGGTNIAKSIDDYNQLRPQIIVGTPGRIVDMSTPKNNKKATFDFSKVTMIVLDEADQILSRGFLEQIKDIVGKMPGKRLQIVLVSATLPEQIIKLSEEFMNDPIKILLPEERVSLDAIQQFYILLEEEADKGPALLDLYSQLSVGQTIIFASSIGTLKRLNDMLYNHNYPVSTIHSDCDNRSKIIEEFRSGATRILTTTDLIARGIDVQTVSLVINYELPYDEEQYIHRIGRSGRYGRKGVAINLVTRHDWIKIEQLKKKFNMDIKELPNNFSSIINYS